MEISGNPQMFRFHEFELDVGAHELRFQGKPVHLERRPFELLVLLVTRQGKLVPREEIIELMWPGKVVIDFDTGLNTLVRKVRQALGDSPEQPRFIVTIPGRGYRFTATMDSADHSGSPTSAPASTAELPAGAPSTSLSRLRHSGLAILLSLVVTTVIVFWQSGILEPERTRIAVFPFENLTGTADLSYLASGLAEETSNSLAQIDLPNLSVIGGVSAKALAGSSMSLQKIGQDLGVDFVVLSSLRLEKSKIRVTSRLIRVVDIEQVWSASFDRELTSVLDLQRELSIAIAEQVRQHLSPKVAAAISRRQTENPEAYALYLKGRYEWSQFQPGSNERALRYYQQAVLKDPGYALAWAGIAHALITSTVTSEEDGESILPAARDSLQHALEYGPELAETQLALGSFHFFLEYDIAVAEAAARQSVALDPNSAMSHMFLGVVLSKQGKHVEARAMLRRARELDPLFPLMFANSAVVALTGGEPREALEYATQAIAINPEFWVGYLHLGSARLALGDYNGAIDAFSDAEKYSGGRSVRATSSRAYALARLGRRDEAGEVLAELISRSDEVFIPPYEFAVVYAGLGEADLALQWLERAVEARGSLCVNMANNPLLETLRPDRRFQALVQKCGLALQTQKSDRSR